MLPTHYCIEIFLFIKSLISGPKKHDCVYGTSRSTAGRVVKLYSYLLFPRSHACRLLWVSWCHLSDHLTKGSTVRLSTFMKWNTGGDIGFRVETNEGYTLVVEYGVVSAPNTFRKSRVMARLFNVVCSCGFPFQMSLCCIIHQTYLCNLPL